MGVVRCVRILVLVSLIPLALRAGSLLGHVAPSPSQPERPAAIGASVSRSVRKEARFGTTRFRHGGGGEGGFGDEKRMAPSGSNPLHNLR